MGEVGRSLHAVLKPHYEVWTHDIQDNFTYFPEDLGVMHICFPYSETFVENVQGYQKRYEPKYTRVELPTQNTRYAFNTKLKYSNFE